MRQRLTTCFRITAPPINRGVLFVLSVFIGMLLTVLGFALLRMPAQPFILAGLHGDWLKLVVFTIPTIGIGFAVWKGLCILSDGTFDNVEVGPEGLVVRGLFGQRHRRWEEISDFTVRMEILRGNPIVYVVARPAAARGRPLRFFLSGCFKAGWFGRIEDLQDGVANWLLEIRAAYSNGIRAGSIPLPPEHFIGRVIELAPGSLSAKVAVMGRH